MSRTNVAEERGPELNTSGRSLSVWGEMPPSRDPLSNCMVEAPTTSICSVWPPRLMVTSRRTSPFGATRMPRRAKGWKPGMVRG